MTNNNTYYNTIVPFIQDLDENIISNTSVDDVLGSCTTIKFHNPVTGSIDSVAFEGEDPNNIQGIFYVIDYKINGINEELIMEDLQDLYDFILMDEEQ
jgi:hypothetical protein